MSDTNNSFKLKAHEHYGESLKLAHKYLEQLRADLVSTYEKSSSGLSYKKGNTLL